METLSSGGGQADTGVKVPRVSGYPVDSKDPGEPSSPTVPGYPSDDRRQVEERDPGEPIYPGVELQPLKFVKQSDDGEKAVYRAVVDDSKAPGAPVYSVTATLPSPGRSRIVEAAYVKFLANIEGAFWAGKPFVFDAEPKGEGKDRESAESGPVLTARPPGHDRPGGADEESKVDDDPEILFGLALDRISLDGTFGVVAIIRNSIPAKVKSVTKDDVRLHGGHKYWIFGDPMDATVYISSNDAHVDPPNQDFKAGSLPIKRRTNVVTIHSLNNAVGCIYDFTGNFNGPDPV